MSKLHLIGNAHLDPVWLWRWQDGFSEIKSTFKSALDRLKEYPDLKFTSACAVYYEWIEKLDPEMFEEIKKYVKEGRWDIVGGWFLQPDCNMPSGESFARHGLISQRYFKEKFGIMAKTGYNVDSFGHNASIPQILRKSGMENYVFMRPCEEEKSLEAENFMWESADGSKVCAFRIPYFYCINTESVDYLWKIKSIAENENKDYMAFYGVGNHGGGPTIELIEEIKKQNIPDSFFSTPDEFFEGVDKENLKTVKDDLQHHAPGCYSACSFVKEENRACEQNVVAAETLCVMAETLIGSEYPYKKLKKAWKNILFNQFHDILCGCSIKAAYRDAGYLYGETMSITEQEIHFAMQKIADGIDTLNGETLPSNKNPKNWKIWEHKNLGMPFVVFNSHGWNVKMSVEINAVATKVTDSKGNEIPFQLVRGPQTNANNDIYYTSFIADIDPLGYEVYRIFCGKEQGSTFEKTLNITENSMENSKIKVGFDKKTGEICEFYHKESGKYIIETPCEAVLLDETDCDTWAHGKDILGEVCGKFENAEFSIVENGDVCVRLRVKSTCRNSYLIRDYTLYANSSELMVKTTAGIGEKHRTLKIVFPVKDDKAVVSIPYGTVERGFTKTEDPCGTWFACGDLCVANKSKYGYDTTENKIRLTAVRTAVYADHFGSRDELCEYMDMDRQEFYYSVFPYLNNADSERKANELNSPLRVIAGGFHSGTLPEKMSCFLCDNEDVVVTAIKKSEDLSGNVIRFAEMNGKNSCINIKFFDKKISSDISHNEIKTFLNEKEVNMLEL